MAQQKNYWKYTGNYTENNTGNYTENYTENSNGIYIGIYIGNHTASEKLVYITLRVLFSVEKLFSRCIDFELELDDKNIDSTFFLPCTLLKIQAHSTFFPAAW